MTREWVFDIDTLGRPITHNAMNQLHPTQAQARRQEWRDAATILARKHRVTACHAIDLWVQPHYPDRRSWPDTDGTSPAVKGILDGLVNAKVIPDDKPRHVRAVHYLRPVLRPGAAGITVKIEGVVDADEA